MTDGAQAQSSREPQGAPYSVSRSRNGCASKASGPSTPVPDHVPAASSSRATTGLTAVCHTTHWWPYSRIDHSLSTTWWRYVERGRPSLPVPVTCSPAHVLPRIRSPSVAGSGRQAATTSRRLTSTPPARTFSVRSRPSRCKVFSTSMNSVPRPYLNVARLASTHRGINSTSSCSTFTHSTGPMPSGKSKTSGSLNGSVVNQPRSFSQITGGLRHSSIVVQIENDGANSWPSTVRFAPSRTPSSSISPNRWSAAYLAKTSDRPGSTPIPTTARRPALTHSSACANWSSPSITPVFA